MAKGLEGTWGRLTRSHSGILEDKKKKETPLEEKSPTRTSSPNTTTEPTHKI